MDSGSHRHDRIGTRFPTAHFRRRLCAAVVVFRNSAIATRLRRADRSGSRCTARPRRWWRSRGGRWACPDSSTFPSPRASERRLSPGSPKSASGRRVPWSRPPSFRADGLPDGFQQLRPSLLMKLLRQHAFIKSRFGNGFNTLQLEVLIGESCRGGR